MPNVDPAVLGVYTLAGGQTGTLGFPLAQSTAVSDKNGKGAVQVQSFDGGTIHGGPSGAYATSSGIMPVYSANGWVRGRLGCQTAAVVCDASGCTQAFSGGTILVPKSQSGFVTAPVVNPDIRALYESTGGALSPFGYPKSPHSVVTDPNWNGAAQAFQNGIVHSVRMVRGPTSCLLQ